MCQSIRFMFRVLGVYNFVTYQGHYTCTCQWCNVDRINRRTVFECFQSTNEPDTIKGKKSQIQTTLVKLFLSQRYVVLQTLLFMPKAAWMIAKLSFHFIVLWESQNHRGYKTIKHILIWNTIPMKNSRTYFPFSFLLHKILLSI